jgi:hypothetical protein
MKLSALQADRVLQQVDCQVISPRHTITPQLRQAFGDHTFFLDSQGLSIVEPASPDRQVGNIVKLASWADESHTSLAPIGPEPTPVAVKLGPGADGAETGEMLTAEEDMSAEDKRRR